MALKIIKASEPIIVEQLVVVIYGQPGIGKSTLAFSAEDPLLLDFDKGAYRASGRKDIVKINSWSDITQISKDDLSQYKSIILDTAGRALDFLTATLLKENHKWNFNGALTLQGYGVLKSRFAAWLNNLKTLGKDVILLAHSSEEKNGDEILERLDVQGGSKAEIYKQADAMGRLYIDDKKRMLSFSPTDTAFGKNPANLDIMQVPDVSENSLFLAELIFNIKESLNKMSDEQKIRQERIAEWKIKLDAAKEAEDFNNLISEAKKAHRDIVQTVKGMLHKSATEAGLIYKNGEGYIMPEKAEEKK